MKNTLLLNGRHIAYQLSGAGWERPGLPLVLLHGFCETASMWEPVLPYLTGLPVLRIDLPGFGDSELPLAPGIESYAAAVCAVLNERNLPRCVLFGHSMGGYTALAIAAQHPERLAGFSLIHAHPYADRPEQVENRRRGIDMLEAGKKDLYVAQLFPQLFAPEYAGRHPEVLEKLIRTGQKGSAEGIIAGLVSMIERSEHLETLRNFRAPVQFILGDLDALNPLERALAAAALPATADIRVFPGVAHMGMFEQPEQTGRAMREFWIFCQAQVLNKT